MKTLKHHFKNSKNFKIFAKKYIDYLNNSLNELDIDSLDQIRKELEVVKRKKKQYLFLVMEELHLQRLQWRMIWDLIS